MITIEIKRELNFDDLKEMVWSGAKSTIDTIEENGKSEEFMRLLEDMYFDSIPADTEINDLLWFDSDYIYDQLGITDDEEENEDDDDDDDE